MEVTELGKAVQGLIAMKNYVPKPSKLKFDEFIHNSINKLLGTQVESGSKAGAFPKTIIDTSGSPDIEFSPHTIIDFIEFAENY